MDDRTTPLLKDERDLQAFLRDDEFFASLYPTYQACLLKRKSKSASIVSVVPALENETPANKPTRP